MARGPAPRGSRGSRTASPRSSHLRWELPSSSPQFLDGLLAVAGRGPQHGLPAGVVTRRELPAGRLPARRVAATARRHAREPDLDVGRGGILGTPPERPGRQGADRQDDHALLRIAERRRAAAQREEAGERRQRRVDLVLGPEPAGVHPLGAQDLHPEVPLAHGGRRDTAGQRHRGAVREHLDGMALHGAAAEPGKARLGGLLEGPEPDLHPGVEGMVVVPSGRRSAVGVDAEPPELPLGPPRPVAGPPRGRRVDRDHVGLEVPDQAGQTLRLDAASGLEWPQGVVQQHEVEALRHPDVHPQRPHAYCRWARNSRRSVRVRTPSTCSPFATSTAGELCREEKATSTGSSNCTIGSGDDITSATSACRASGSRNSLSRRPRSRIEPTKAVTSVVSGSRTTGAWEVPWAWRRSTAWRTFPCAPTVTTVGSPSGLAASTRSTRACSGRSTKPYCSIHVSEYSFDR